jgi:hypothetical protein
MNGAVQSYFEYSFMRMVDLEVLNNEVYIAEAFAPRVYRIDLTTGDLQVIIDDWSLFYFYGLAFDGTYFYVDEWDLNRYDINGNYAGTASFDETVFGAAWDGDYYWMLDDNNQVRCWNISQWPTLTEILAHAFTAPDTACRGLWFDGEYFWTAQSLDGVLGSIYKFDYTGTVVSQWLQPAFSGWAACVVDMPGINEHPQELPVRSFILQPCSPNPFRHCTDIRYQITDDRNEIVLRIYDIRGREVRDLTKQLSVIGYQSSVRWDGRDARGQSVPAGVYILRLEYQNTIFTQKIIRLE